MTKNALVVPAKLKSRPLRQALLSPPPAKRLVFGIDIFKSLQMRRGLSTRSTRRAFLPVSCLP